MGPGRGSEGELAGGSFPNGFSRVSHKHVVGATGARPRRRSPAGPVLPARFWDGAAGRAVLRLRLGQEMPGAPRLWGEIKSLECPEVPT